MGDRLGLGRGGAREHQVGDASGSTAFLSDETLRDAGMGPLHASVGAEPSPSLPEDSS